MALSVGFLGIGGMGARMAANIARAGFPLRVYNRTRTKAEELAKSIGVEVADSPAHLATGCDVLITMVADAAAVEELYAGPQGALKGLRPGSTCIEMSTIGPEAVLGLGGKLKAVGASLLDAPVSGSLAFAATGQLTVMVGGAAEDLERVRPVLSAMSSRVFHVGQLGSGATMKLAVNAIVYGLSEALSEALVLAESAGIERQTAYEVFANSAIAAPFVHYRREAFLKPGEVPVGVRLALARKDMKLILSLAQQSRASMPQAETNLRVMDSALAEGLADEDVSVVAEYLRHRAAGA